MTIPAPPLLVISDRRQARASLEQIFAAAFAGGCRWASIREKDLPAHEQVALVHRLLPVARRYDARLTLHGDPALAARAGADGVHLPAGADVKAARDLLGPAVLIGISVHFPHEATALDATALDVATLDYVVAGPAYETASKPGYGPGLGAAGIAAIAAATRLPVIAIGGIDAGNAAALMTAGASGVALMGGVMRSASPEDEVRELLRVLGCE